MFSAWQHNYWMMDVHLSQKVISFIILFVERRFIILIKMIIMPLDYFKIILKLKTVEYLFTYLRIYLWSSIFNIFIDFEWFSNLALESKSSAISRTPRSWNTFQTYLKSLFYVDMPHFNIYCAKWIFEKLANILCAE